MKNKSILYRFGLVVLVVLLLVLILPSSKIDLSSSLSACSQMTVRTEKITSFASGDDLQYHLLSMDDAESGSSANCCRRSPSGRSSTRPILPTPTTTPPSP